MSINQLTDIYASMILDMREGVRRYDGSGIEPFEARARVWDEALAQHQDRVCILARAMMEGVIRWCEPVDWQTVYDMLIRDMGE